MSADFLPDTRPTAPTPCPCRIKGPGQSRLGAAAPDYSACCARFHHTSAIPPTAEALMRSRYTAFVLGETEYLLATHHHTTRPASLMFDPDIEWLGLKILAKTEDGDTATVEFVARMRSAGKQHRMHEVSLFQREGGRWFYVDGTFPDRAKRR
ncbi:MAG: YchJ family metal-binding protein [Pseudomonadota bacterium]